MEYSDNFIRENSYWLDHNIEARERFNASSDHNYDKEQAAITQILKKPKLKGNPVNPFGGITSTYNGQSVNRSNPYAGIN